MVDALVVRIRAAGDDDAAIDRHRQEFGQAMSRLRADSDVESQRFFAASDNVVLLRETAGGLRQIAVESMSLEDEVRRYLLDVIQSYKTPSATNSPASGS